MLQLDLFIHAQNINSERGIGFKSESLEFSLRCFLRRLKKSS